MAAAIQRKPKGRRPAPARRRPSHQGLVINLVLSFSWYDMMIAGLKDAEYRTVTAFWTARIWRNRDLATHVLFHRGYTSPILMRTIRKIDIGGCPYPGWSGDYYRIHLYPLHAQEITRHPSPAKTGGQ